VNFLDVTLNLKEGTFEPYMKNNNTPIYINTSSNHPPSIIKHIPISISRRLSENSSNINIFNKNKIVYNNALKINGHKQPIEYTPAKRKPNHRTRNIIWFNPPFNKSVTSNIGKIFLNLIRKHFPPNHPLAKIFNKNNLKISYSCTKNISQIIKSHNKKVEININKPPPTNLCNCRVKNTCPFNGSCLQTNAVYRATVKHNSTTKHYIGATEGTLKQRSYTHKLSFTNTNYSTSTSLSTYIWNLKNMNIYPKITWEILKIAPTYNKSTKKCLLCLQEKLSIITHLPHCTLLNKKSEILSKCRHENKHLLSNYDPYT